MPKLMVLFLDTPTPMFLKMTIFTEKNAREQLAIDCVIKTLKCTRVGSIPHGSADEKKIISSCMAPNEF